MPEARLTRRTARRGDHVAVTFRDGRPELTGTLDGWGSQLVVVIPDRKTTAWPWKKHSVSVVVVDKVTRVPAHPTDAGDPFANIPNAG